MSQKNIKAHIVLLETKGNKQTIIGKYSILSLKKTPSGYTLAFKSGEVLDTQVLVTYNVKLLFADNNTKDTVANIATAKIRDLESSGNSYILEIVNVRYASADSTTKPTKPTKPKKPKSPVTKTNKTFVIVLDPGHGGTKKLGGSSPNNATARSGILEKTLVLDLAKKIQAKLNNTIAKGQKIKVLLTRSTDVNKSLAYRRSFPNKNNANLYLSLHFNGFHKASAIGTEIFISSNASKSFAETIVSYANKELNKSYKTPLRSPGTKGVKRANFGAIRNVKCPSALLESEFISNKKGSDYFSKASNMQNFANAIARGLIASM